MRKEVKPSSQDVIAETFHRAERVQYSPAFSQEIVTRLKPRENEQTNEYIHRLLSGKDRNTFAIAPEVRVFLADLASKGDMVPRQELEAFLLALAATPKPADQVKLLDRSKNFLDAETLKRKRHEWSRYFLNQFVLETVEPQAALFEYYGNLTPEERKSLGAKIEQSLETAQKKEYARDGTLLLYKSMTLEERFRYQHYIDRTLEIVLESFRFDFVQNTALLLFDFFKSLRSEEFAHYQEPFREFIEKLRRSKNHGLLLQNIGELSREIREEHADSIQWAFDQDELDGAIPSVIIYYASLPPAERKGHQNAIQSALQRHIAMGDYVTVLKFCSTLSAEERPLCADIIEASVEYIYEYSDDNPKSSYEILLEYYAHSSPDVRASGQSRIDEIFSMPHTGRYPRVNIRALFQFLAEIPSEERSVKYMDRMKIVLSSYLSNGKQDDDAPLFAFLASLTSQERTELSEPISGIIRQELRSNVGFGKFARLCGALGVEDRELLSPDMPSRIPHALASECGNLELKEYYLKELCKYVILHNESLLALDLLMRPRKAIALTLGLQALEVTDPLPALSWDLSSQQRETLLLSFKELIDSNNLSVNSIGRLSLPYRPRGRQGKGFEDHLVRWFTTLRFFYSLPVDIGPNIASAHIRKFRDIVEQSDPSLRSHVFLRQILKEIRALQSRIPDILKDAIDSPDLSSDDIMNFFERWNNDVASILVYASRVQKEGSNQEDTHVSKNLLAEIIHGEVNNDFFDRRYDLKDPLVRKQLKPLIGGLPKVKAKEVLTAYHEGARFLHNAEGEQEGGGVFDLPIPLPQHVIDHLAEQIFLDRHVHELFKLPAFSGLTRAEWTRATQFGFGFFRRGGEPWEEVYTKPTEFRKRYDGKVPSEYIEAFISLHQFFGDVCKGRKPPSKLLKKFEIFAQKFPKDLIASGVMQGDIFSYLQAELTALQIPRSREAQARRALLIHTTDHPKTLLEIGKYPANTGSCQSYDYPSFTLAQCLLGYVFDAHIMATVVREFEVPPSLTRVDDVEILSIDERLLSAQIQSSDGSVFSIKITKPIAREISFFGKKGKQCIVSPAREYVQPGAMQHDLARQLLTDSWEQFTQKLKDKGANIRLHNPNENDVTIAGSRNPAGHYNDIVSGACGEHGESYMLSRSDDM
ncbi:hypothetical protein HY621_00485 [Candidatus Uhrbacteria bacterium]|nr:hypothetical protein [Candidatus Uhrbacteria bacterium]